MDPGNLTNLNNWVAMIEEFEKSFNPASVELSTETKDKVSQVQPWLRLLKQAFEHAARHNVDDTIYASLSQYWGPIQHFIQRIPKYLRADDAGGAEAKSLIVSADQWLGRLNVQPANTSILPFPTIFAFVSALEVRHLSDAAQESEKLKYAREEYVKLTYDLRSAISDASIDRFANLFALQSLRHSRFLRKAPNEDSWWNRLRPGAAEIWVVLGSAILISGLYYFFNVFNASTFPKSGSLQELFPFITERIVFLSVWFFAVRFCFRNFSLNKNLSVLNAHRANLLNTFRLFLQTVDSEDKATKSKIISEVAQSISMQGPTGYLADKELGPSMPKFSDFLTSHGKS